MKIKILSAVYFLLFLNSAFAQESYIINKDGEKIIVDGSKVELLSDDDMFQYYQLGIEKKNKIDLDEITTANLGEYRIEKYTLDKKPRAYFIIAETAEKKLVGYNKFIHHHYTNAGGNDKINTTIIYNYYVIDKNNKLIEKLDFTNNPTEKATQNRNEGEAIIVKHFSDCPELIRRANALHEKLIKVGEMPNASNRLKNMAGKSEELGMKFSSVFNEPYYSNCYDKKNNLEETHILTLDNLSQYDGTYQFESFTMYKPIEKSMVIKGTFIIRGGFVDIVSKGSDTKYKITSIKDGIIYLEDKSMVHNIKLTSESGKKKGTTYDTKIFFIADRALGFTADYWCKKD